jgi:uncharacterized membrane protein
VAYVAQHSFHHVEQHLGIYFLINFFVLIPFWLVCMETFVTLLVVFYSINHHRHHHNHHLESSPVDYMKWRFSGGVDREDLARPSLKVELCI